MMQQQRHSSSLAEELVESSSLGSSNSSLPLQMLSADDPTSTLGGNSSGQLQQQHQQGGALNVLQPLMPLIGTNGDAKSYSQPQLLTKYNLLLNATPSGGFTSQMHGSTTGVADTTTLPQHRVMAPATAATFTGDNTDHSSIKDLSVGVADYSSTSTNSQSKTNNSLGNALPLSNNSNRFANPSNPLTKNRSVGSVDISEEDARSSNTGSDSYHV
jgi:hypothetical protein